MSYPYNNRGGYSGSSSFATEQALEDLKQRINAVYELVKRIESVITPLTEKVDQMSEDIADIVDDMFGSEENEDQIIGLNDQASKLSLQRSIGMSDDLDGPPELDLSELTKSAMRTNRS